LHFQLEPRKPLEVIEAGEEIMKNSGADTRAWIAPVSLLIPLSLTFVTATFRDALGLTKDTWQAVFLLGIVVAALWTFREIATLISRSKSASVEELIQELKKGAVVQRTAIGITEEKVVEKRVV
jgi:hypothetical protein